jgi:hypothetical protein
MRRYRKEGAFVSSAMWGNSRMKSRLAISGVAALAAIGGAFVATSTPVHASGALHFASRIASNTLNAGQAGYEANPGAATESVSAKWTVPAITCDATTRAMAPGSWIFDSNTGVPSGGTVEVICSGGSASFVAAFIINGAGTAAPITVSAGDSITTTVTVSATSTKVTIKDNTTAVKKSKKGTGTTPGVALAGVETFVGTTIPTFTKDKFSACKIDGGTLAAAGATAQDLEATPPTLQISTGALNGGGNAFTETFHNN